VIGVEAVEAEDRVEMHHATSLELGDLGVGHPHLGAVLTSLPGEQAADVLGGTPPQLAGVQVPHHLVLVVVAPAAQGLAEALLALAVGTVAHQVDAVRAVLRLSPGPAGQGLDRLVLVGALLLAAGVDVPERGAVKVANMHGCPATCSGMPLPPRSPARMSW
jgi:hypothetical protein